jgi:hypothetical protein
MNLPSGKGLVNTPTVRLAKLHVLLLGLWFKKVVIQIFVCDKV